MDLVKVGKMALKARQTQAKMRKISAVGISKDNKVAVLLNGLQELEEVKLNVVDLEEFKNKDQIEKGVVQAYQSARKDLEKKLSEGLDLDSIKEMLNV